MAYFFIMRDVIALRKDARYREIPSLYRYRNTAIPVSLFRDVTSLSSDDTTRIFLIPC